LEASELKRGWLYRLSRNFWDNALPAPPSECILWMRGSGGNGYGEIRKNGRPHPAHRVAWELANRRSIPKGLYVKHSCDVRLCVNPRHLRLGTHQENMLDMRAKGRSSGPKGENNPWAKLTEENVRVIEDRYRKGGISQRALASKFGVSHNTIGAITRGEAWKKR